MWQEIVTKRYERCTRCGGVWAPLGGTICLHGQNTLVNNNGSILHICLLCFECSEALWALIILRLWILSAGAMVWISFPSSVLKCIGALLIRFLNKTIFLRGRGGVLYSGHSNKSRATHTGSGRGQWTWARPDGVSLCEKLVLLSGYQCRYNIIAKSHACTMIWRNMAYMC